MQEREAFSLPGVPVFLLLIAMIAANGWQIIDAVSALASADPFIHKSASGFVILMAATEAVLGFCIAGFFIVQPNQGTVLQFFGRYVGTCRAAGPRWTIPFFTRKKVSLRVRNFESSKLKVNDLEGSPIEIAAIVVWQVEDTAQAVFQIEDYENFVHVQSESALRQMATSYPYDLHEDHKVALRSHSSEINQHLKEEIEERVGRGGINIIEAKISHLAYAAEIAQAMLQRQQASAIIAARTKIVEGAVSMVHMALEQLTEKGMVQLDEERRAAMVSNLLVVLCGERGTQPVVNTGSLY